MKNLQVNKRKERTVGIKIIINDIKKRKRKLGMYIKVERKKMKIST